MPQRSPIGTIIAIATAIVAVGTALAVITDKLCCHLISFYAAYRSPVTVREPDFSETDEQPLCPDAAR